MRGADAMFPGIYPAVKPASPYPDAQRPAFADIAPLFEGNQPSLYGNRLPGMEERRQRPGTHSRAGGAVFHEISTK